MYICTHVLSTHIHSLILNLAVMNCCHPYTLLPNNGDTDVPTLLLLMQLESDLEQCERVGG